MECGKTWCVRGGSRFLLNGGLSQRNLDCSRLKNISSLNPVKLTSRGVSGSPVKSVGGCVGEILSQVESSSHMVSGDPI